MMSVQTEGQTLKGRLWDLLEPVVADEGLALWDLQVVGSSGRTQKLEVYVDRMDGGISLDDCATISKRISAVLDVEDLISTAYNLEVSSPGINRVLHRVEHFQRFLGENIRLRLAYALDGRRNLVGSLCAVSEEKIEIDVPELGLMSVPKDAVRRANLVVDVKKGPKE